MTKRRNGYFFKNVEATLGLVSRIAKRLKRSRVARQRAEDLRMKYSQGQIHEKLAERVHIGQTKSELIDVLGEPTAIDKKLLATKSREIWKYHPRGVNRFALRVTLDDEIVVGWESKSQKSQV